MTREELMKLVEEIMTWEGTEEELAEKLDLLKKMFHIRVQAI